MSENIKLKISSNKVARIYLDTAGKKANVIDANFVTEMTQVLDDLLNKRDKVKGLIILSKKDKLFIAGADVQQIRSIEDPQVAFEVSRSGQILMEKIEQLPFPTAVAIDGTCVGGGLELSLACTYMVGTQNAQLALPEVKLGIIPGWGGTQRLPKRVGLVKSIELIGSGRMLRAQDALKCGLLDAITLKEDLETLCERLIFKEVKPKKRKTSKFNKILENTGFLRNQLIFPKARQNILKQTKGNYPAPIAALEVLEKTYGKNHRLAYEIEAQKLAETLTSQTSKHLVTLFLNMEAARKKALGVKPASIDNIGVLGAGVMGGGIAHAYIQKGIPVRIKDIASSSFATAYNIIFKLLSRKSQFKKNPAELEKHLLLFSPTYKSEDFKNCNFIIEAVVEDIKIKKMVFQDIEKHVTKKTVLASNTSALSITEMASSLKNPGRMIGVHFFNPVNKMPLVELVMGRDTDEKTLATAYESMIKIGKTPIIVKDKPGFLVNRILVLYLLEALRMADEGVDISKIEDSIKKFGFPMGPFELVDEVGIDVAEKVGQFLSSSYQHFPSAPDVLSPFIEKGYLGKKTQNGFYHHGKSKTLNTEFLKTVFKNGPRSMSEKDIEKRLIYLLLNECQHCLDENIVETAEELDLGMVLGTGFPPFKGGPSVLIESIGKENLKSQLEDLASSNGNHFKPAKGFLKN